MSPPVPTIQEIAQQAAEDTRAAAGDSAVFVIIVRGSEATSSFSCAGQLLIDTVIAAAVQLLGDLRVRVMRAAQEQAAKESRGHEPAGN